MTDTTAPAEATADPWASLAVQVVAGFTNPRSEDDIPAPIRAAIEASLKDNVNLKIGPLASEEQVKEITKLARLYSNIRKLGVITVRIYPQPDLSIVLRSGPRYANKAGQTQSTGGADESKVTIPA